MVVDGWWFEVSKSELMDGWYGWSFWDRRGGRFA